MYGIILVAVIAIIAGLLLSWASIQFAVPVDEKQAAVREVLPGANCGACVSPVVTAMQQLLLQEQQKSVFVLLVVRMLQKNVQQSWAKQQVKWLEKLRLYSVTVLAQMQVRNSSMMVLTHVRQ